MNCFYLTVAYFVTCVCQIILQHIRSKPNDPTILLHPSEYFLICMFLYPKINGLALNPVTGPRNFNLPVYGVEIWIRSCPYMRILNEYLKTFVPRSLSSEISGDSMLFLSFLCEFWLDSTVVRQDHYLAQRNSSSQTGFRGTVFISWQHMLFKQGVKNFIRHLLFFRSSSGN